MNVLGPMEPRTLKENVLELLRQAIIDGRLPPGAELNQAELADKLGISRGPLREALGQLEQEGLIESVPYKGVVVTPLTREHVEELYSIRSVLETFALERGLERVKPEDLEQLNWILDKMRVAAQAHDEAELVQVDLKFHEYLVQMANHKLLLRVWKLLEIGVRRCLHTRHRIYQSLDEVIGTHPALVDAIAERNIDLASRILREHVLDAAQQIVKQWPAETPEGATLKEDVLV